jgi:hypothetical protein
MILFRSIRASLFDGHYYPGLLYFAPLGLLYQVKRTKPLSNIFPMLSNGFTWIVYSAPFVPLYYVKRTEGALYNSQGQRSW